MARDQNAQHIFENARRRVAKQVQTQEAKAVAPKAARCKASQIATMQRPRPLKQRTGNSQ